MTIDGFILMTMGFMIGVMAGIGAGVILAALIDIEAEEERNGTSDRQ